MNLNPPKGWLTQITTRSNLKDERSKDERNSPFDYLFPGVTERTGQGATPEEIVAMMDEAGIEKGILNIRSGDPEPALRAIEKYPGKFAGAVPVNPLEGLPAVKKMERLVKENPFIKAVRVSAFTTLKPYNDRTYYPLYAKCVELGIPVTANVGLPAPRVPGEPQNPIHLDEVCWFFPDLKVVMTHCGEPWQFTCVKLMLKWPNLYYMTSAFAPRYYPPEIIHYMNTRGADKVMFATDYPMLPFDRCMREVKDLPLKEHVRAKFLRENALKVFRL
ncbi:MAG: amidohydrolase [Chloroflexi bacterium]|nr:amidohydrolase [Chloroflexota bacterium]